jgi:hypothetical protein
MKSTAAAREEIRKALLESALKIHWDTHYNGIFAHVDSLIEFSEGNTVVRKVELGPHWAQNRFRHFDGEWEEKLGKALGNLQSLEELYIVYPPPDWETFALVLRHVEQKVTLYFEYRIDIWRWPNSDGSDEAFATAIRGHPAIQGYVSSYCFHNHFFDILLPVLASLPALEYVRLKSNSAVTPELTVEERDLQELQPLPALQRHEDMTAFLLSPSLRSVSFERFHFQEQVCRAIVSALETQSSITRLDFLNCTFPNDSSWCSTIVQALERNSILKIFHLYHEGVCNERLSLALTGLLRSNTTLVDITLRFNGPLYASWPWIHPFFEALRFNTSLKKVSVNGLSLLDEPACEALRRVLVTNKVLDELSLGLRFNNTDDTELASWLETLIYLRHNKTLKTLTLDVTGAEGLFYTVLSLAYNNSLESLDVKCPYGFDRDSYLVVVSLFVTNTRLKTLRIPFDGSSIGDDGMKDLISIVKKNYGLECLDYKQTYWGEGKGSPISAHDTTGELDTIFKLNRAGRRYLIQEGPESIANGIEVLVAVRDDLGCLFYHLLENPTLCDIEHRNTMIGPTADRPTHPVVDWTDVD